MITDKSITNAFLIRIHVLVLLFGLIVPIFAVGQIKKKAEKPEAATITKEEKVKAAGKTDNRKSIFEKWIEKFRDFLENAE